MRVKTGFARRRAHSKIHQATKGYRMTKRRLVKVAKETLLHAGVYAYNSRREKKQDIRKLWIIRINGALAETGLSYSRFIKALKDKKIEIDRKIFAELIQDDPQAFQKIVEEVKK
ncbi:MAG: 50S ribosomal protein L20 [Patescibacteria group bacterium]|nr:50S ribosomal protein L20 [Patescibacteria group bacterium]